MAPAAISTDIRILVVDDFEIMRRILRSSLRQEGFLSLVEASGGEEAMEVLKNEKVDLVIADWHMPDMPGLDLLENIRSDKAIEKVPFLMLANREDGKDIPSSLKTIRTSYITKPFSSAELAKKIKVVCKKPRKAKSTAGKKTAAKGKKRTAKKSKAASSKTSRKRRTKSETITSPKEDLSNLETDKQPSLETGPVNIETGKDSAL